MPEQKKQDWGKLPTEELEQLLQEDLEQNTLSDAELLEISAILAERETPEEQADVDAAWEEFCAHYRPAEDSVLDSPTEKPSRPLVFRRRGRWLAELAALAAVFTAVLLLRQGDVPAAAPRFPNVQIAATLNRQLQQEWEDTQNDSSADSEDGQDGDTVVGDERVLNNESSDWGTTEGSAGDDTAIMIYDTQNGQAVADPGSGETTQQPDGSADDGESDSTGDNTEGEGDSAEPDTAEPSGTSGSTTEPSVQSYPEQKLEGNSYGTISRTPMVMAIMWTDAEESTEAEPIDQEEAAAECGDGE